MITIGSIPFWYCSLVHDDLFSWLVQQNFCHLNSSWVLRYTRWIALHDAFQHCTLRTQITPFNSLFSKRFIHFCMHTSCCRCMFYNAVIHRKWKQHTFVFYCRLLLFTICFFSSSGGFIDTAFLSCRLDAFSWQTSHQAVWQALGLNELCELKVMKVEKKSKKSKSCTRNGLNS